MESIFTFTNRFSDVKYFIGCLSVCLFTLSFSTTAQTSKEYTAAQVDLLMTDLDAGNYDIYELSSSGGNYTFTGTAVTMITLNRSAIIRAKAGLTTKPILTINGSSTGSTAAVFVPNGADMSLRLEGIEFNGTNANAAGGIHHLVRSNTTATNLQMIAKDCYFHQMILLQLLLKSYIDTHPTHCALSIY